MDTRPFVHFTPPAGWLNDPNGLVSVDGEHHLFYQHHPHAPVPGPMHWGHAVSRDFIAWRDLPIALEPDEHGMIFSGSAVVDADDTAGFGPGALVVAFTYHRPDDGESQAIAWSVDRGRRFHKFAGNPVIATVAERPWCRDPKLLRYPAGTGGHWVMVLAAGPEIWIYTSTDLRAWRRTDVVGGFDDPGRVLETPELFALTADDGTPHWVLAFGVTQGAPAGSSGTMAQVGEFDGERFSPAADAEWVDGGADFYAAQSWNDVDDGRRIWVAWMGNWGRDVGPGTAPPWRGQLSIPRELALTARADGYRLAQVPVRELELHRGAGQLADAVVVTPAGYRPGLAAGALDIVVDGIDRRGGPLEIRLARAGEELAVTVDVERGRLSLDHRPPAPAEPVAAARAARRAVIADAGRTVDVRIVVDTTSIEVFCGPVAISDLFDTHDAAWTVQLTATSGTVAIAHVGVHPLLRSSRRDQP